jgi:chromosome segregation ATPase
MAEGSETPGDEPQPPTERDLLAERRARRAIDSDPTHPAADALTRRAEAAEATVQTLETHLASLQQQVLEAAGERAAFSERLGVEQAAVAEREHELRRVKQREYAEQQLRVEAEDRRSQLERDSRSEIDRLTRRLGASEHHARELAAQLDSAQRELAEAEQAAAAELAAIRSAGRSERELQVRLSELEHRTLEIGNQIDSERSARAWAERQLLQMRDGYRKVELLVGEMKGVVAQLRAASARSSRPAACAHDEQREELADALTTAEERLRSSTEASVLEYGELTDVPAGLRPSELERPTVSLLAGRSPHKHSMSLLTRLRLRRKQRRERRSAAAGPPTMQSQ